MRYALCALLFFLPFSAFAASGFPSASIWLSKENARAGEIVYIRVAVHNASEKKLSGSVVFIVDGKEIGEQTLALESGASAILSAPWTVSPGEHRISARIEGGEDSVHNAVSGVITVAIEKPPPSRTVGPLPESIETANALIRSFASSSPSLARAAQTALNATEGVRLKGAEVLGAYIANYDEENAAAKSSVRKEATSPTLQDKARAMLSHAVRMAAAGALSVFHSPALFYPLLGLTLLVLLYLLARRLSSRSYRR